MYVCSHVFVAQCLLIEIFFHTASATIEKASLKEEILRVGSHIFVFCSCFVLTKQ